MRAKLSPRVHLHEPVVNNSCVYFRNLTKPLLMRQLYSQEPRNYPVMSRTPTNYHNRKHKPIVVKTTILFGAKRAGHQQQSKWVSEGLINAIFWAWAIELLIAHNKPHRWHWLKSTLAVRLTEWDYEALTDRTWKPLLDGRFRWFALMKQRVHRLIRCFGPPWSVLSTKRMWLMNLYNTFIIRIKNAK